MTRTVAVVGGGLVGLATAYKLLQAYPGSTVTVLEKEQDVGQHQSGHNSGVLHAGFAYAPGSMKARLAASGWSQMVAFCQEHDIPHELCGKLVVATTAADVPRLRALHERGERNGLEGLAWCTATEIADTEPHARGVAALRVPGEGIVDFQRVAAALAARVRALGGSVITGRRVLALRRPGAGVERDWVLETTGGDFGANVLVNCAGLQSDRIARMAGERPATRIVPFRGEYYTLRPERCALVRHLIYPVPDPAFPFLGVHFTRRVRGGVIAGPSAVLALAREGYRRSTVVMRDVLDGLAFTGLWRFLARYPAMAWAELRRSFSRDLFCAALRRLVPEIAPQDLVPGVAGVRAQAMRPNGALVEDFEFLSSPRALHVLNAPSPGATASLAIGDTIVAMLQPQLA